MKNMVDECFELVAVICRLAGRPEYSSPEFNALNTEYHKEVAKTFAPFSNHNAVEFVKKTQRIINYDKPLRFAVHIKKENGMFAFIDDINSLSSSLSAPWTIEAATEFLQLCNKFYVDTNYAEFFNKHLPLFEETTKEFVNRFYKHIDFEWFGKYLDPSNLRCILSLSSGNYFASGNNKILYCLVQTKNRNGEFSTPPIVHEYCHAFANPIATKWYNENAEFRKWCDDSVDKANMPYYNSGIYMAYEYVTRAYNVLYEVEHGNDYNEWIKTVQNMEINGGFPYMEQVYNMILALEKE